MATGWLESGNNTEELEPKEISLIAQSLIAVETGVKR